MHTLLVGQRRLLLLVVLGILAVGLPSATAIGANVVPPNFTDTLVNGKVSSPTSFAFLPDGRVLLTEQTGTLRVVSTNEGNAGVFQPMALDPSKWVHPGPGGASWLCTNSERGLLSVAIDPGFATNSYIYLYYTYNKEKFKPTPDKPQCPAGTWTQDPSPRPVNRFSRFKLNLIGGLYKVDVASELVLLDNIPSNFGNHNAGDAHFGKDGYIYVSAGDGGCDYKKDSGCAENNDASRDLNVLSGKILRITRDGAIPPSNPYTGADSGRCNVTGFIADGKKCQETYASGLRNPFRIALDPNAADVRIFANDVGQRTWEEINDIVKGSDYGWNNREGFCAKAEFSTGDCRTVPNAVVGGITDPLFAYSHPVSPTNPSSGNFSGSLTGVSITGGAFVPNGGWSPEYDGNYLFSDYGGALGEGGWIGRLAPDGRGGYTSSKFASLGTGLIAIKFGPYQGGTALYYTTYSEKGQLRRIVYSGNIGNRAPIASLSASPESGPQPLLVTLDGRESGDPNAGDTLTYRWTFGDGTAPLTTTTPTTTHTYTANGVYTATLVVQDQLGATSSADSARITVSNNTAPVPTITAPASSLRYSVGQQIVLQGGAADAQDGQLSGQQLSWKVTLHHDSHTHPFLPLTPGTSATITAPAPEDLAATTNSWLEIELHATDSQGLTSIVTQELRPKLVSLGFASTPPGLQVSVNGFTITTPRTLASWPGYQLPVDAPTQQDASGTTWRFSGWSDGAAAAHQIVTGDAATIYTATFTRVVSPTAPEVTSFTLINADTDQPIQGFDPIPNNATLDLAALPTRNLNVRANTVPARVGSVRFGLNDNPAFRTANSLPYALAGGTESDYAPWTPAVGSYTLVATPFGKSDGNGTPGIAATLRFTVTVGGTAPPPTPSPTPSPTPPPTDARTVQHMSLILFSKAR